MADYGILGGYNTDPMRGVLADPRMAYRTQFRDGPPQQGYQPPSFGTLSATPDRPSDWAVSSGLAETLSPTVQGYGAGQMAGDAYQAAKAGDYGAAAGGGLLAAMSMLPMKGKGAPIAAAERPTGIRAYHGSPHDFDKFDLSKIGTGEGAQAYGHGLYFADNEGVAKSYRDALSGNGLDLSSVGQSAKVHLASAAGDIDAAISKARSRGDADAVADLLDVKSRPRGAPGRMYEVNINADPAHFLDWDKPIDQQPPLVREALEKTGALSNPDQFHAPYQLADGTWRVSNAPTTLVIPDGRPVYAGYHDSRAYTTEAEARAAAERMQADVVARNPMTGNDAYENLRKSIGGKPAATDALRQHGVAGVRYLDGGSRAAGDGSRNYVVFDPVTIEIMRKYGLLGPMAGGAAAGATQSQPGILGDQ